MSGLLVSLAIALGLGLLIGLQREWVQKPMAGIRTFPLVALLGGLSAAIAEAHGGWVIAAALLGCVALMIFANVPGAGDAREEGPGLTTEFALLVTFAVGVAVAMGYRLEATVCAGIVMVLLQGKSQLHGWVGRFGEGELREISRLVLLGLVILPLLPNREMGYLGVINPFKIWLMVVLIVGISLAAYLASKFIGGRKGAVLSGVLGGLISSTATTAGMARRSKSAPESSRVCALVVMIATAIVFVRVMAEIWIAGGEAGRPMLPPFAAMLGWAVVVAWVLGRFVKVRESAEDDREAPSEFKAAVVFALLYVGVLLGVAYAKEHLGDAGLYAVAAISGLTDMDAITLSTAELVGKGHIGTGQGWRVILLGGLANLVFKAGMVAVLAHRSMLWPVLAAFGATAAGATALWIWWPG
ncbi:MgtC/SapB family protein [Haloferula sp. A504]|uniref:MgtC/SapB family protein n=1 Tax=Haloferula sp. A504 TaxID=3373601 RepID=UPI0031C7C053|nr:MgtC/SapB family protein [Verrucomicrobiaceae bacterium E54]